MKYTIKMSCGHEETVELIGPGKERERKLAYYENFGLCKECYKRKMEEKENSEGLYFNASFLPYVDEDTGKMLLFVWFSGNTRPAKEAIKGIGGYRWTDREAADDWYKPLSQKCWGKTIDVDQLEDEAMKAAEIGAESVIPDQGLFALAHYEIAKKVQKEWQDFHEKIDAIPKPEKPDILKGHKWNGTIYGRKGYYSIYPDGDKVNITDEQADEIKKYLDAKEEYKSKISQIRR